MATERSSPWARNLSAIRANSGQRLTGNDEVPVVFRESANPRRRPVRDGLAPPPLSPRIRRPSGPDASQSEISRVSVGFCDSEPVRSEGRWSGWGREREDLACGRRRRFGHFGLPASNEPKRRPTRSRNANAGRCPSKNACAPSPTGLSRSSDHGRRERDCRGARRGVLEQKEGWVSRQSDSTRRTRRVCPGVGWNWVGYGAVY